MDRDPPRRGVSISGGVEVKVHFRTRLGALFILLLVCFILIQALLVHFFERSLLLSSVLAFLMITPLAYLILKFLTQPIQAVTELADRVASGSLGEGSRVESEDEMGRLSKAINEMRLQLQNKIEEVSREKDYLQALLGGVLEGVLVVDGRGRIKMVNDALRQLLSLPPSIEGRTPLEVIRHSQLEKSLQQVLEDGQSTTLELTLPSPQEKTFEVNLVGIPPPSDGVAKGEEGRQGVIAVFHDITRLKELEKIRQDFVANVSHELRTPLTTIKGYAETLLDSALGKDVAPRFVEVIKRHADRLEKIVEDLLMLSKIESKEFVLSIEPVSLSELIVNVLDFLRESLSRKRITVSYDLTRPLPLVRGDRHYLEQVFVNLLDNAIKYGREGGEISISVAERGQREAEVSVRDDGIGIPKEDLPRIFERFYRVDKGRSKELGGTGLGLSIVKHIVQAHGGRIWAESTFGKGSTFHFTLPLRSSPLSP